jgi:dihydroorotate dehydrogenase
VTDIPSSTLSSTAPGRGANGSVEAFLNDLGPLVDSRVVEVVRKYWSTADHLSGDGLLRLTKVLFEAPGNDASRSAVRIVMDRWGLPFPAYDINLPIERNTKPWGAPLPERPSVKGHKWTVLGQEVGVPIGVPASPLTWNSDWVEHQAKNGYNIITYKTVRARERQAHPYPNWRFSNAMRPVSPGSAGQLHQTAEVASWPDSLLEFSTVNSLGVPSKESASWIADVRRATSLLSPDQLLILSVMGDYEDKGGQDLVDDFSLVSQLACTSGVTAVELNLSCPSGIDSDGEPLPPIGSDPGLVLRIVESARRGLTPGVGLIVKFAYLDRARIDAALRPIAELIDGVSGVNSLQAGIRNQDGTNVFPGRRQGGISGFALRELALDFVQSVVAVRQETKQSYDILAMGGVMNATDAMGLFVAGASVVQTASGACFNHRLAYEVCEAVGREPNLVHPDRSMAQRV